jgi:hypothetical protein
MYYKMERVLVSKIINLLGAFEYYKKRKEEDTSLLCLLLMLIKWFNS